MIFAPVKRYLASNKYIAYFEKPLYECIVCMSSFWSVVFWFAHGNHFDLRIIWVILTTAGWNVLLGAKVEKAIFDYYKMFNK